MAEEKRPGGFRRNWLRVALIASLCVNLLVVGAVGGVLLKWSGWQHRDVGRLMSPAGLGPIVQAFDRDRRSELGRKVRSRGFGPRSFESAGRSQLEGLIAVLNERPYRPEELDARFAEQRRSFLVRMEAGHELLAEQIGAMSDEERSEFASRLEHWYDPRGREGKHR